MPSQKDLKKIVRARMQKTGEAYTAARLHIVRKKEVPVAPVPDYALAGMSHEAVKKATGRDWKEWVSTLDAAGCREKPHSEIVAIVSSLGTPNWWSQMVTVGYERIRGLRAMGQRRGGSYEANKSRTFAVPIETLFEAFTNARKRGRWLDVKMKIRTAKVNKTNSTIRATLEDGSPVQFYLTPQGTAKSAVALTVTKLADKEAVNAVKQVWAERLEKLAKMLG